MVSVGQQHGGDSGTGGCDIQTELDSNTGSTLYEQFDSLVPLL